jgi:hypothetical protein
MSSFSINLSNLSISTNTHLKFLPIIGCRLFKDFLSATGLIRDSGQREKVILRKYKVLNFDLVKMALMSSFVIDLLRERAVCVG